MRAVEPEASSDIAAPFWAGLRRNQLLIQRCTRCDTWRWTPQLCCPHCLEETYEWTPSSGRGRIYSYTRVHRSPDPTRFPAPFTLVIVALEEGPHLLSTLVDCDDPVIDLPVAVRFLANSDGELVYPFAVDLSEGST